MMKPEHGCMFTLQHRKTFLKVKGIKESISELQKEELTSKGKTKRLNHFKDINRKNCGKDNNCPKIYLKPKIPEIDPLEAVASQVVAGEPIPCFLWPLAVIRTSMKKYTKAY